MNDFIIQCRGLTKNYGTKTALEQVEFSIGRGRIVGLLGPNGSGKTTLIKLLCGLLQPTSGELLIDGHTPGAYTKGQVSYLPDRMYVADWMKVRDLMGFFRDFYQDFDGARLRKCASGWASRKKTGSRPCPRAPRRSSSWLW